MSIADLALVPQVHAFYRYNIDLTNCPKMVDIYTRLEAIPAFRKAHAYRQIDTPSELKIE